MKAPFISDEGRPQTDDDFWHAADLMCQIGSDFTRYLGFAYMHADLHNQARLRAAFPDLFTRYFVCYSSLPKE
jgi:hypothetical protein